jgi:tRNA threonylcarbamoyladenosine biosynthesis protein TsaE
MEYRIESILQLEEFATQWLQTTACSNEHATLVTLSGELGAGKTAFVKAVAKALGISENVQSPTFVIERRYAIPPRGQFTQLIHIDAYRLDGGKDLERIGWERIMRMPRTLILLEWPELVRDMILNDEHTLRFTSVDEHTRLISTL